MFLINREELGWLFKWIKVQLLWKAQIFSFYFFCDIRSLGLDSFDTNRRLKKRGRRVAVLPPYLWHKSFLLLGRHPKKKKRTTVLIERKVLTVDLQGESCKHIYFFLNWGQEKVRTTDYYLKSTLAREKSRVISSFRNLSSCPGTIKKW